MLIAHVLRNKGADVHTAGAEMSIEEAARELNVKRVGALVVMDGAVVAGVLSERDIVRTLHHDGPDVLKRSVASIMSTVVATCGPESSVDDLAELMTQNRVRHIPVLVDARLAGIVSIGDVVKTRVTELEGEARTLEAYIHHGR